MPYKINSVGGKIIFFEYLNSAYNLRNPTEMNSKLAIVKRTNLPVPESLE